MKYLDQDRNHILRTARQAWPCDGDGRMRNPEHKCGGTIEKGQQYVEYVGEVPAYASGSRHCIACHNHYWGEPKVTI